MLALDLADPAPHRGRSAASTTCCARCGALRRAARAAPRRPAADVRGGDRARRSATSFDRVDPRHRRSGARGGARARRPRAARERRSGAGRRRRSPRCGSARRVGGTKVTGVFDGSPGAGRRAVAGRRARRDRSASARPATATCARCSARARSATTSRSRCSAATGCVELAVVARGGAADALGDRRRRRAGRRGGALPGLARRAAPRRPGASRRSRRRRAGARFPRYGDLASVARRRSLFAAVGCEQVRSRRGPTARGRTGARSKRWSSTSRRSTMNPAHAGLDDNGAAPRAGRPARGAAAAPAATRR